MARPQRHRWPPPRDYRDAVLATNPVGYWRLGEKSGTVARDEMGVNHGTYAGSPTLGVAGLLAGDSDTAVTFDGVTQIATLGTVVMGAKWSMAAWMIPTALPASGLAFYLGDDSAGMGFGLGLDGGTDSKLMFLMGGISFYDPAYTFSDDGSPHFIVFTYDSTAQPQPLLGGYVDGAQTLQIASAHVAGTYTARVGGSGSPRPCAATVDEPMVWGSRALSPAEIAELYRVGMGR